MPNTLDVVSQPSAVAPIEWLDRHPWLPFLILVIAPFLGHSASWLTGLSSNPIWTESGSVIGIGPSLVVGGDFGDPNVGWTNQALGHLAAQDWLHFTLPWWNPYSGIGLPLAGEMQPAAMFLPFVLLLTLQNGMFWLEISLQIFAGLATFSLLRRLDLGRLTAVVGGLLFAFSGTFAWVPGETILNVVPFLPLLLLGIEDARDPARQRRAVVLIAIGIGGSILAGFPEAAYIDGLFALMWTIVRLFQTSDPKRLITSVVLGGIAGLLIAAPQIVAFADFSLTNDVFQTHQFGSNYIPPRGFAVTVLPYVFGPLGTSLGSSLLLSVSGGTGGYVGALLILFGAAGLVSRRDRPIAMLLAVWLVLSIGKSFGFSPILFLVNAVPLMKEVMFWRYSSQSWELALIIPACFALEDARTDTVKRVGPIIATLAIVGLSIWLAWPWAKIWHWNAANRAVMVLWLFRAVSFECGALLLLMVVWLTTHSETRRWVSGVILVLNTGVLFMVPQLSGHRPGHVDWDGIKYLQSHLKLRRFYTLGPIDPNYSAYFNIPNLNHNYLPTALNWTNFIHHHLFTQVEAHGGNIFYAPFPPMSITAAANDISRFRNEYQYLGVRYIVTSPGVLVTPSITYPATVGSANGLALYPGQSITFRSIVPPSFAEMPPINQIGINQGNYDNEATGIMSIKVCASSQCTTGAGNLRQSHDNTPFTVTLATPIILHAGEHFTVTVTHRTGTSPDAIWLYPDAATAQLTNGTGHIIPGRTVEIVFSVTPKHGRFTQVYSDQLMTIWRLKGADPFYSTIGGSCMIQKPRMNTVTVICPTAARLVRRELFMAGWRATDNGEPVAISLHHAIVQSIPLHPGRNHIQFRFAPPYAGLAWVLFWLGVLIMMWQGIGPWITAKARQPTCRHI
ncbi:MAG: hypothetical protein PHT60_03545 [Acidiphilium sp.]|nr:hypothetical protein [Acidiphilium sp.]MDD4934831.1 hypothetical protein [Acidiphilium sp.]